MDTPAGGESTPCASVMGSASVTAFHEERPYGIVVCLPALHMEAHPVVGRDVASFHRLDIGPGERPVYVVVHETGGRDDLFRVPLHPEDAVGIAAQVVEAHVAELPELGGGDAILPFERIDADEKRPLRSYLPRHLDLGCGGCGPGGEDDHIVRGERVHIERVDAHEAARGAGRLDEELVAGTPRDHFAAREDPPGHTLARDVDRGEIPLMEHVQPVLESVEIGGGHRRRAGEVLLRDVLRDLRHHRPVERHGHRARGAYFEMVAGIEPWGDKAVLLGRPVVNEDIGLGLHGRFGRVIEVGRRIPVRGHGKSEAEEEASLFADVLQPGGCDDHKVARAHIFNLLFELRIGPPVVGRDVRIARHILGARPAVHDVRGADVRDDPSAREFPLSGDLRRLSDLRDLADTNHVQHVVCAAQKQIGVIVEPRHGYFHT